MLLDKITKIVNNSILIQFEVLSKLFGTEARVYSPKDTPESFLSSNLSQRQQLDFLKTIRIIPLTIWDQVESDVTGDYFIPIQILTVEPLQPNLVLEFSYLGKNYQFKVKNSYPYLIREEKTLYKVELA